MAVKLADCILNASLSLMETLAVLLKSKVSSTKSLEVKYLLSLWLANIPGRSRQESL